ncbi:MAG: histidine kinase, partial [Cyanobacteria bacterium J06633_2]
MGKRSLKASEEGQVKAKNAFARTRWTQEQLAFEVGLSTRQSVWKFFTGRPIERNTFIDLCFYLNLEWEEIADLPAVVVKNSETSPNPPTETSPSTPVLSEEDWVEKLRQHLQPSITKQCGLLQSSLGVVDGLSLERIAIVRIAL